MLYPRIMLIDDHALLREAVGRYLGLRCGALVVEAPTGALALPMLAALRPEVVVIDVELPGEPDGLTLVRHVRAQQPGAAVLACSATPAYAGAAQRAGAQDFFWKASPTFFADLCAAVCDALQQGQRL